MHTITLTGTDIRTTAIGFGTSALMGKLNAKESLRLLEVAYENGVRHFDTAPAYGYGEAEGLLGAFLRTRSDVTVATKFGLARPQTGSFVFRQAKRFARPLLRGLPGLRAQARRAASGALQTASNFDPVAAAHSLTESLHRLGRDCVDVFLLHECRQSDLSDEALLQFMVAAKTAGRIRAFGIATDAVTVRYCIDAAPAYAGVVQLANNAREPNLERMPELTRNRACLTHSPFGGIGNAAAHDASSALGYAVAHNPDGVVLFSSQHPQHIVDNLRSLAR